MKIEHSVYKLGEDKVLVEGYRRSALYDLVRGCVFSVNREAQNVLLGVVPPDESLRNMLDNNGIRINARPERIVNPEVDRASLDFAWLEVEDRCNWRCLHCYGKFASHVESDKRKMTYSDWARVIDQLSLVNCSTIQFIGGEPLLFKKIFDLGVYAKQRGIRGIEIFTNGSLASEFVLKEIKRLNFSVATSFYSADEDLHDEITQNHGSYKKSLTFITNVLREKIPLRVGLVVMKQNEDTIEESISLLRGMGVDKIRIDVVRPTGRGEDERIAPSLDTSRRVSYFSKPNFKIYGSKFFRNMIYNQCNAGKMAITSAGEVIPCIFDRDRVVGSVFDSTIDDVLHSGELESVWATTKDQILVCKDCEYRYACHDCRPLAESTSSKREGPDPRCTYNPYMSEWNKGVWKVADDHLKFDRFKTSINDNINLKGGEI